MYSIYRIFNIKRSFVLFFIVLISACGQKGRQAEDGTAEAGHPLIEKTDPGDGKITDEKEPEGTIQLTDAQWRNAEIVTGHPEPRSIPGILKLNGSIDVPPQNMVSISAPMGGYLKSTRLLSGLHVAWGETIAVMEDQQYIQLQQDYLMAKAKLLPSRDEYLRQQELNRSKASSDKVFQQAEADYSMQKILLRSLSEKLRLISVDPDKLTEDNISRSIRIASPIDGFVSRVNVNIGKYVNPADVLFEIVNPADIHLALTVFEKDLPALAIGQKLVAYTNIDPAKKYPCEIILIGKNFSKDRSVEVHCHFRNYDKMLIPGMFMNAEVEVRSKPAIVVPSGAIVSFQDKQYIFVDKGEKVFGVRAIRTGDSSGGFTAIYDADDLGNQAVVVKGAYNLLMKWKNGGMED